MADICLLHGAWHDGSCWAPLRTVLEARGHRVIAPDLPYHDPRTTAADRARPALDVLDPAARPLVVGHSMGSRYAPLVAAARPGALAVYLCPGLGPLRPGFPWPPTGPDGTCSWTAEDAVREMYSRLPAATAHALAGRLRPMAPATDRYPKHGSLGVRTAAVCATDDEFFAPATERARARKVLGVDSIEISGGHFPMVEDPARLADLLEHLAHQHIGPAGR